MPLAHQLAAVSLLKLVLALHIVSCSPAPAAQPPSPQLGDAVAYRFPAFDGRTEHSLVVATSSSIISPAAFLFDAQFFPEFNRSEGFVLLSRTVQLWSADTGTQPTREASFNTSFTLDDASPLTFVVLLDSFPPLASRPVRLRGANSSTFSNDTTAPNASDNLAAVAVGAVSSYGPESPDVGLNVTVTPNGTEPRSRTVWIEYSAVTHHLWVYLAAAGEPRPLKALLDAPLNLAGGRTTQNAFVGFFAATVRDVIHGVRNWELTVDKFPGSDGNGENGSMSTSSWLVILLVLLGSVAATAGIVTVVICYSLSRRREALEMEQIMKQSYPHPTRRGVRPRDHP